VSTHLPGAPAHSQTSAAINLGNSGGALADINGRVIGIPTLAAADPELGGSAPGIGFAIPSNLVADIAGQIVAHGKVVNSHRAFLGIRAGDTNGNGVLVGAVTPDGAAAKAGIRVGDTIESVRGRPTPTTLALATVLAGMRRGEKVRVAVRHGNGTRATLPVTLGAYPGGWEGDRRQLLLVPHASRLVLNDGRSRLAADVHLLARGREA